MEKIGTITADKYSGPDDPRARAKFSDVSARFISTKTGTDLRLDLFIHLAKYGLVLVGNRQHIEGTLGISGWSDRGRFEMKKPIRPHTHIDRGGGWTEVT